MCPIKTAGLVWSENQISRNQSLGNIREEVGGRGEEASENFLKVNLSEELRGRFGD
jgi:hypothetical protein